MPSVAAAGGLPTRLGKYEILTPLATGGMARIYVARTTGIGSFERHVVLKLITPERANDTTAVQMFLDEARLAAALNHQNVAQVFEVGEDVGIHYLAMEYVHGQDLRALLAKAGGQGTRVPLELALTVVAGAAAGLHHAHERRDGNGVPLGIVHRDVSPSNIMIGYDGAVKLLDFGIAKATSRSVETQSGIIKGKFAYMAPEQCRGRDVDRRSDVFSLGIILYEITTQHRCFRADSDFDTMHRIVTGDVVRPSRLVQGYPTALEAIVMKALAVDANQRYQSSGFLLEAIESFAVSSRMSLSTMALGRFMRDMFGEMPEPWLAAGRGSQQVMPQPKESTISNTNGSREVHQMPRAPSPRLASEGSPINAARTLLDLPRDHQEATPDPNPNPLEWNARSYPQLQPQYASSSTLPPESMMARASQPAMPQPAVPAAPPPPTPAASGGSPGSVSSTASAAAAIARGSQPIPPSLHPATATPIVSTKHGYANAPGNSHPGLGQAQQSEVSYPRYEPPADSVNDLRLVPNRRPLYIGIGIVALGVAIVLVIALTGGSVKEEPITTPRAPEVKTPPPAPTVEPAPEAPTPATNNAIAPPQGSAQPVEPEHPAPTQGSAKPETPTTPVQAGSAAVDDGPQPGDESISIHVISDPAGADVLLAGKVIGTTPLTTKLPRGTGSAMLTVHKARYVDVQTKLDLTGSDFSKTVTLKKVDDRPDPKQKPPEKKQPVVEKKQPAVEKKQPAVVKDTPKEPPVKEPAKEAKEPKEPAKPKCQPPGRIDPFDTSCNGGPCPPCAS